MIPPRQWSDARLRKIGFSAAVISLIVEYNAYLVYKGTHPIWSDSKGDTKEPRRPIAAFTTINGVPIPHFVDIKRD